MAGQSVVLRHRRRLLALAIGLSAAHGLLLLALAGAAEELPRGAAPLRAAPSLQVRPLVVAPPAVAEPQALAAAPARQRVPQPAVPGPRTTAIAAAATIPPAAEEPAVAPGPAPSAGEVPVYATRPPAPFARAYTLQRGAQRGELELHWQVEGGRYEARMAGTLAGGVPLLALHSAGGFDAAGLAPQRHTDRRRGRSLQAANFQRASGRITFSGPAIERPLPPGVQDRLSWLLQLAAIAAADPALATPGGRISLVVVGVRGDADVWTFVHAADESLALAGQDAVPAVRLLREPAYAYDTRAEVWLDPAQQYLPLRVRLSNRPSGSDTLEFEWRGPDAARLEDPPPALSSATGRNKP